MGLTKVTKNLPALIATAPLANGAVISVPRHIFLLQASPFGQLYILEIHIVYVATSTFSSIE